MTDLQLCIVVPCYNEEEVLPVSSPAFVKVLEKLISLHKISESSYVLFVDDGSSDQTWRTIVDFASKSAHIKGLKLSRNKGHQVAVFAGISESSGDLVVSMDADLQDDPAVIEKMLDKYVHEQCDIVYGVRSDRTSDTAFKRLTAECYYKFLKFMGVEIIPNHADFRLLSRRAADSLLSYPETNLFLRGMVPLLGYQSDIVTYSRAERHSGISKYPVGKMLSLAWEGITSLSIRPLRLITAFGVSVSLLAFCTGVAAIVAGLMGISVAGWASIVLAISFFGGVQLLAIGLIGEYVGKIYLEVKHRPKFFIESRT